MLDPNGAYLLLAGEFASRSRRLGAGDSGTLIKRKWHRLAINAPAGERHHGAGNLVLLVSGQPSNDFQGSLLRNAPCSSAGSMLEGALPVVA